MGSVVSPSLTSTRAGSMPSCVGGGLGHDGVGAGAEILRAEADEDAAVGQEADDGCGGGASCAVVGGGHAVADEVVAFDDVGRAWIAVRLDQPKRSAAWV